MSDITGDAFTIHAAEEIIAAIEHVGKTAAQEQIGKALEITDEGAILGSDSTTPDNFIGIVKAVSGEGRATFAKSRMVNDLVTGADPTEAPYYDGNVDVPAGRAMTVERNCITYILMDDGDIEVGDLIKPAADGKFTKANAMADAVGRAYSIKDANSIVRAYIHAY